MYLRLLPEVAPFPVRIRVFLSTRSVCRGSTIRLGPAPFPTTLCVFLALLVLLMCRFLVPVFRFLRLLGIFPARPASTSHRALPANNLPVNMACTTTGSLYFLTTAADAVREALAEGIKTLTDRLGVSSAHVTFATDDDIAALDRAGFLMRTDQQFHWVNDGYESFEAFLAALASRKRKNLKKERARAVENGIEIEQITGADLTDEHWDKFFEFYIDTGHRKWGTPYLTRAFFDQIGAAMADDILLIMAKRDGRYIAGALNFIGGDTLFGRNWGCIEDHPFLHFEVCYYQAIDFAIKRGLRCVEAGAQGAHKLARGYAPKRTHSAHHIAHEGLRDAVADYLESERQYVDNDISALSRHTPFKKTDPEAD